MNAVLIKHAWVRTRTHRNLFISWRNFREFNNIFWANFRWRWSGLFRLVVWYSFTLWSLYIPKRNNAYIFLDFCYQNCLHVSLVYKNIMYSSHSNCWTYIFCNSMYLLFIEWGDGFCQCLHVPDRWCDFFKNEIHQLLSWGLTHF